MRNLFNIFSRKRSQLECDVDSFFNAVKTENIQAMDLLLEKYPSALEWQDKKGRQPLLVALHKKKLESFRHLLAKGVNPNTFILDTNRRTDGRGYNAYHVACQKGMTAYVQALLEKGADRNLRCEGEERDPSYSMLKIYRSFQKTGEELAIHNKHFNVANVIKNFVKPGPKPDDMQKSSQANFQL